MPWNVAGIPPEAREAARAAARREGLSVGEWVTRRILNNSAEMPDDMTPSRESWTSNGRGRSFGNTAEAPRYAPFRHDTEEMLAHVARSETESTEVYRRIEDQLKNLGKRLESTERTQSENSRAMRKAATEINIATREQSQAFEQLGTSVVGLSQRLEHVERATAADTTKEAVKGLHTGLSRLADQITSTANQSATQISALATSVEALATRIAETREEGDQAAIALEQNLGQIDNRVSQIDHYLGQIDQRLSQVTQIDSRVAQLDNHMVQLDQRLGKLAQFDANLGQLAGHVGQLDQRVAHVEQVEGRLDQIDQRLAHVEQVEGQVAELDKRFEQVSEISTHVAGLDQRLAQMGQLDAHVAQLDGRLEQVAEIGQHVAQLDQRLEQVALLDSHVAHIADQLSHISQIDERVANIDARVAQIAALDRQLGEVQQQLAQMPQMEQRVGHIESYLAEIDRRTGQIDHVEERIRAVERGTQATQESLNQALLSIESRKDDDAAALRRDAETATAIGHLQNSIAKLETQSADPAVDRRLTGIERTLSDIVGRVATPAKTEALEDTVRRLSERIEAAESRQRDQIAELRSAMNAANSFGGDPFAAHAPYADPFAPPPPANAADPYAPPRAVAAESFAPPPAIDAPPFADTLDEHGAMHTTADAFAPPHAGEPVFEGGGLIGDPFQEGAPSAAGESYLSAVRRSARAAAAQADAETAPRVGGFSWGTAPSEPTAPSEKRGINKTYLWIGIIAALAVFAIIAGALLSRNLRSNAPPASSAGALFTKDRVVVNVPPAPVRPAMPAPDTAAVPAPAPASKPSAAATPAETTRLAPPAAAPATPSPAAAPAPVKPVQTAALTPLDKLTALANAGNGKAELVVGLKYLDGDGVPVNEKDAAKWLERAAEQGVAVAQYRLGTLYERGRGVKANPAKATHWYQVAAQAGNRKAMHNLAVAYAAGNGVKKDLAEAARWFSKAAGLGLADSQFNLAVLYERGLGVPQSLTDAYKWYAIAAANGDTESKARIDALATQISADDRAAAQRSAEAFHPQQPNATANVAPTMNGIAG